MKRTYNILATSALSVVLLVTAGCSKDFLAPSLWSFYEPGATFKTESGIQAQMAMADRHLRSYWTNYQTTTNNVPISTEYLFSELASAGKTDMDIAHTDFNLATALMPTTGSVTGTGQGDGSNIGFYWGETYNGIKYANTILRYIDGVEDLDEDEKNVYRGQAYFHRAFRYLALVCQFGDVPLVTKILDTPKLSYKSTAKTEILKMITADMEKAVGWVPDQSDLSGIGYVNKGACRMLLAKCYLVMNQAAKAKEQLDILIDQSGYALMKNPFGQFIPGGEPETWPITRNVIWDLHRPENKPIAANTEAIMVMPNHGAGAQALIGFQTMRIFGPYWDNATNNIKAPDGTTPRAYARSNGNYRKNADLVRAFGRGIGTIRNSWYATHEMWKVNGVMDEGDLRHSTESGNWVDMESMVMNDPASTLFGEPMERSWALDTVRSWYAVPLYKIWLLGPSEETNETTTNFPGATDGGNADWYLYRLAEAYLLRAEAKLYMGDATAVDDVNEVRERAGCTELYTTVNIGDIMDERARELYLEEWRNMELKRVSYCLALTGTPDEWGNTYDVATYDKQTGTDAVGGSYWYQRVNHHGIYNKGGAARYDGVILPFTMDKKNLYWPIPHNAIEANNKGVLKQNHGYGGNESAEVWTSWEDAVADEEKTE